MDRRTLTIVMILLVAPMAALAQHGKISGNVVDQETKEPLIGANVVIVGTTFGAATGLDGSYVILNVAPGLYDVKASYIGYQEVTVRNISVVAGLTQEVGFNLASSLIELQPVVLVAERPLIQKSATNAIRILKGEEIEKLPVRGTEEYLSLQPGVVFQNDRIHIRGSRPDEVGYTVEGANSTNIVSRDGGSLVTTIPEALEELLVQAGGYTAEFGGANAGIVQQNFRTGGDRYHAGLQFETDNFADPGEKFLGTYSYGYTDYVATFSGPVVGERVRFFLAGENFFMRDYIPTFWSGSPQRWSDGAPVDTVRDTGLRDGNKGDFRNLSWLPGNIPGRFRNRYSLNGTVLFDLRPVYVKLGGAVTWQRTKINDDPIRNLFNQERLPLHDLSHAFLNLKLTYFVSSKAFIETNVSFLDRRFKRYDPIFEDDLLAYTDSLRAAQHGWMYPEYSVPPFDYDFHGFPFARQGTPNFTRSYRKNQTGYWGGSASLTWQVERHELELGGSLERWTTRNYGFVATGFRRWIFGGMLQFLRRNPDIMRDEQALRGDIRRENQPDMYGFDELGNRIDKGPDGPKHPKFFSTYVQDKFEFEDLIINAGLRFDYMDTDTWSLADPLRPMVDDSAFVILNLTENNPFQYLSPRLGFSFPVSDRTVFHLQFGKFVQPPALDVAFRGIPRSTFAFTTAGRGFRGFFDPVSFGLQPTRSTQYEVGFTQQFTDFAAFDLTAFYKGIKGQVQYDFVTTAAGWEPSFYPTYSNEDFVTTKGLEFRLTLRRVNRVQAQLNYTFSSAKGTNSFPTSAGGAAILTGVKPTTVLPLQYDQAHRGSINIDYRFGKDDAGPLLDRLGLNILFTFNSGHRFTKERIIGLSFADPSLGSLAFEGGGFKPLEPINTSTTPWNFNLDLRLDKTLSMADLDVNFYVYVQNVLNTRNITNVYLVTGNAFEDGFLTDPDHQPIIDFWGPRYVDLYRAINLEDRRHHMVLSGLDLFDSPRQIRFGLRVEV